MIRPPPTPASANRRRSSATNNKYYYDPPSPAPPPPQSPPPLLQHHQHQHTRATTSRLATNTFLSPASSVPTAPILRASSYDYPRRRRESLNASSRVFSVPLPPPPTPKHQQTRQPSPRRNVSSASRASTASMADFADGGVNVEVGDVVAVPGGMTGAVKFVGNVRGKNGLFAGVELSREYAARGKNDGDVDGIQYFTTSVPGAGIFLPAHRPVRVSSPSIDAFPSTPSTPGQTLRASSQSPQTPSMSKLGPALRPGQRPNFSQSIGPGARAPSPQQKIAKSRPSLPRPESPIRKQASASNIQTPGRASTGTASGLSASVRGQRPSGISPGPRAGFGIPKTPGAHRSPSRSQSRTQDRSPELDSTPTNFARTMPNGTARPRAPSRAQSTATSTHGDRPSSVDAEENARLKRNLDERDKQLKEQAVSLAEMESSLADLQAMVADNALLPQVPSASGDEPIGSDVAQLRILLRDKTDKIASLTAEFDNHRADFRSTIDTLEMASTETERVYEERVQELLGEVKELQERHSDVDGFARELKRLEEFVQELEEGLEDARRGEAEARSEVEFLRGEVERTRTELRREREKSAKALKGATGAVDAAAAASSSSAPDGANGSASTREMAARDDEIRGLKAIIHSLSSGPDAASSPAASNRNTLTSVTSNGSSADATAARDREDLARLRASMDTLAREKNELRGLLERKNFREDELERELAALRADSSGAAAGESTPRKDSAASARTAIRPGTAHRDAPVPDVPPSSERDRHALPSFASPLDGAAAAGSAFRPSPGTGSAMASPASPRQTFEDAREVAPLAVAAKSPALPPSSPNPASSAGAGKFGSGAAGGSSSSTTMNGSSHGQSHGHEGGMMAQLTGEGPVAGRASGRVDLDKWCALCERDGHDSVDCPIEEEF